ncbi:hypothetical protein ILUMI_13445 [Ignelater luminosus]|uniref:Uncharacterized protein n=1 Tax=Ignelater luminosus TaxID=2038154 RepID=A0A8K0CUH6_IGNLU|nr:hypothetical protein ILUMI_13445 [Ignelater luminosus]
MAKKGQAVQLQQELNTDEEWEKFIQKPGLLVIDIYSEWSGPCSAMVATLKKIKIEFGGENIQYAIAKADTISYLERFRGKCEPTWMFVADGKMVNLMYGANVPKLTRMILSELKKEEAAKHGQSREARDISQMADEERVRYDVAKAIEDERIRIETERKLQAIYDRRLSVANHVLQNVPLLGVILVFPHAMPNVKGVLEEFWEPANLAIAGTEKPRFTEEIIEELLYFAEYEFPEMELKSLLENQSMAYVVKPYDADLFHEDMDDFVLQFVYGESKCPPGSPDSPAQQLKTDVPVPKEVKEEPAPAVSLAGMPSMPSISALKMPSSTHQSKLLQSKTQFQKSSEAVASKETLPGDSKLKVSSKPMVISSTTVAVAEPIEEEKEETIEVAGLWAPPDPKTRALAIKLLFPRVYDPIALPEPVPIPPHIAIAFDAVKRREVIDVMNDYPDDIMRFGFFTTDSPETAKLVAKTVQKYERHKASTFSTGEKLVIQLSKKRSEPWCVFSQLSPTFMSHTPEEGEVHCKIFFPEDYDEEEEVSEVVEDKSKQRGKREKPTGEAGAGEGEDEEDFEEDEDEGDEDEEGEEGEDEDDTDALLASLGISPED